ncbi:MAG: hypothetical protein Q7J32_10885 [Sphingomonadaceae bacterium]|nr:hypothetical protein [Sphingomonadaceae bacterium]
MQNIDLLSALSLFTIAVVVVLAGVLFVRFMRKPGNRHPLAGERGHQIEEARARENAQHIVDTPLIRR